MTHKEQRIAAELRKEFLETLTTLQGLPVQVEMYERSVQLCGSL